MMRTWTVTLSCTGRFYKGVLFTYIVDSKDKYDAIATALDEAQRDKPDAVFHVISAVVR